MFCTKLDGSERNATSIMDPLKFQFANSLESPPDRNAEITDYLERNHVPHEAIYFANLAVEELVTNVVKYGYDDSNDHVIEVHLSIHASELAIEIIDDGHPFDPCTQSEPDTTLPAEDRPIGGLGLHLVRQMSDRFSWEYRDGKNYVCVVKSLAA